MPSFDGDDRDNVPDRGCAGRLPVSAGQCLGCLITFNNIWAAVWPMIAAGWVTNIIQRGAASMGAELHSDGEAAD